MPKNFVETVKDIADLLKNHNPNIILNGPPGTGKTYTAMAVAYYLIKKREQENKQEDKQEHKLEDDLRNGNWLQNLNKYIFKAEQNDEQSTQNDKEGRWAIVQFHPAYHYEDLIQGIEVREKDGNISYEKVWKILSEMSREALVAMALPEKLQDYRKGIKREEIYKEAIKKLVESETKQEEKGKEPPPYILIIDEINRANLPAVLGELIYALEYRNKPVKTLYGDNLIIPPNLYIIGTMNTADKSAGRIDYAIRRRFLIYKMLPEKSYADPKYGQDLMNAVNEFIRKNVAPDYDPEDIMIGHTYFISKKEKDEDKRDEDKRDEDKRDKDKRKDIAYKFIYQVVPLLHEYIQDRLVIPRKDNTNDSKNKQDKLISIYVDNNQVKVKLKDKTFSLKGGRLVDDNGRPVDISDIETILTDKYPLPLALSVLLKENVDIKDKIYENIKRSVIETLLNCEEDKCIDVFYNSLRVFENLKDVSNIKTDKSAKAYVEGEEVELKIEEVEENGRKLFRLRGKIGKVEKDINSYINSYEDLKYLIDQAKNQKSGKKGETQPEPQNNNESDQQDNVGEPEQGSEGTV